MEVKCPILEGDTLNIGLLREDGNCKEYLQPEKVHRFQLSSFKDFPGGIVPDLSRGYGARPSRFRPAPLKPLVLSLIAIYRT